MSDAAQIIRNGGRLLGAREKLFSDHGAGEPGAPAGHCPPGTPAPLRAEIAASWQRSRAYGLQPHQFSVPYTETAAPAGVLRLAAAPVADAVGTDLAGTSVGLLMSDNEARIVDRRVPDSGLRAQLDRLCLAPGFQYGEEAVGTTAISVALSQHGPAIVAGGEHYADTLTPMVCVAAPVTDPRTGRALGTIGLACAAEAASPLMIALVKRVTRDVEQRLTDSASGADRTLVERFLRARRQAKGPLAAVSARTILTNSAAVAVVGDRDRELLWDWASGALHRASRATSRLRLSGGQIVTVRASRIDDGSVSAGALLSLDADADADPAGEQSPGHREHGWDSLTATERIVAAIIAEGVTNREAAARLYLSRHTIDYHLRQIFRKLGVTSRVELTRLMMARGGRKSRG